jgi:hypothetical protein
MTILFDLESRIRAWLEKIGLIKPTPTVEQPAKPPIPEKVQPAPVEQQLPQTQPASSIIPTYTPEQQSQMPPYSPTQTRTVGQQETESQTVPAPTPAPPAEPAPVPSCPNPTAQHNIYLSNGSVTARSSHDEAWEFKRLREENPSFPQVVKITRIDVVSDPTTPTGTRADEVTEYP